MTSRGSFAARLAVVALITLLLTLSASGQALAAKKAAAKKKEPPVAADSIDAIDANLPGTGGSGCYKLSPGRIFHRCEPQSLPYGRCRTGNMSCRGNYQLSPIGWYKCADSSGKTTGTPVAPSILILGDNSKHRMSTGHVFVVEKVKDQGGGRWDLVLSHTNYDRKCSLETNVSAGYDEKNRIVTMHTGKWSPWGKSLKALGFIVK
jgi:hypothetical protein